MKRKRLFAWVLLLVLLAACQSEAGSGSTHVWIDVPLSGIVVPQGQPVNVEGHASNPGGVEKVEMIINGQLIETLTGLSNSGDLSSFISSFTPSEPGEYVIQVVAYGPDGNASKPDDARIFVGDPTLVISDTPTLPPTSTWTPTPVITDTPTPVISVTPTLTPTIPPSLVQPVVDFRADPPEIDAGKCSRLIWHVENVQSVVFGGVEQAFDGSYEVCLCETKYYPLTVVYMDGSSEKITQEVKVNGVCATPVPEEDTTPPPIPQPQVPANGLNISCKSSQTLAWLPVDDPSGISGYKIEVQRHSGDNNWQNVTGSPFGSTGKSMELSVECGWNYRWRVMAIDGKGNQSGWSSWFQFAIILS